MAEMAVALDPDFADGYDTLAHALEAAGRKAEAGEGDPAPPRRFAAPH